LIKYDVPLERKEATLLSDLSWPLHVFDPSNQKEKEKEKEKEREEETHQKLSCSGLRGSLHRFQQGLG